MDAARHTHNSGRTVRAALFAGRLVFRGIPGVGDLLAFGVDGDAGVIALRRSHHAVAPVFGYDGNPVSGEVDRSGGFGGPGGLRMTRPVACTSLAAVAGFLSFGFSPLAPVRMFGLFTGVGALFGLFLSFTVVPALLVLVNPAWLRPREIKVDKSVVPRLAAGFAGAGQTVVHRRWWVVGGALAVLALTPLGLRRLVVQDSWTNGFDPESEFRRVTQQVNENFFGMHLLYISADAPKTIQGEIAAAAINSPDMGCPPRWWVIRH